MCSDVLMSQPKKKNDLKLTDWIQAISTAGLLIFAVIGYFLTVKSLYSKAILEEEASKLKLEVASLSIQKKQLEAENARTRQQLDD